ncbi:hypothetical protein BKA67DRAFT_6794 [Truncatella angustata]|uniref:F-box domain-containing protein n=1 Tax=Truncatella angustata TaxID=152316 RepID=A0A9P8UU13_9PEZI|nr:uncharacterized protein BKA67DRAFT_6794 [Truncatella angustata]KAH6659139.1 hypothetical protein BKA67DRAFT_6794 [Truncatella angustata]
MTMFTSTFQFNTPLQEEKLQEELSKTKSLKPGLESLPTEIHILISQQLIYPDALSLKHTCRHFYSLVDTGIKLKVTWLMERRSLHLECPNERCDLGSDLKFCRGSIRYVICAPQKNQSQIANQSLRLLMRRRREHMECESRPGLGCLVYGTGVCTQKPQLRSQCVRWLRAQLTFEIWWILLALVPLLIGWFWVLDCLR